MLIKLDSAKVIYFPQTPMQINALDDVSFSLVKGETVGVIGLTGSGKSTFGQALAGLIPLSAGSLAINGLVVPDKLKVSQAYKHVSFLFQKPEKQLFESNIYDEVAFGPRNLGLDEEKIQGIVKNALDITGLDYESYIRRSPFNLSGGEMRRLGIAAVLALQSPAIIMDEPTAGLDMEGKLRIVNFLKELKKEKRSLVLISHDLDEILQLCDRLIILDKGRIVHRLATTELVNNVDLLEEMGLFLPDEYILAAKLKKCGYPIDGFDREAIKRAIEVRLSG